MTPHRKEGLVAAMECLGWFSRHRARDLFADDVNAIAATVDELVTLQYVRCNDAGVSNKTFWQEAV